MEFDSHNSRETLDMLGVLDCKTADSGSHPQFLVNGEVTTGTILIPDEADQNGHSTIKPITKNWDPVGQNYGPLSPLSENGGLESTQFMVKEWGGCYPCRQSHPKGRRGPP